MNPADPTRSESFLDVLRQAIADEDHCTTVYERAARLAHSEAEREILLRMVEEEKRHRRQLEDMLAEREMLDDVNRAIGG